MVRGAVVRVGREVLMTGTVRDDARKNKSQDRSATRFRVSGKRNKKKKNKSVEKNHYYNNSDIKSCPFAPATHFSNRANDR